MKKISTIAFCFSFAVLLLQGCASSEKHFKSSSVADVKRNIASQRSHSKRGKEYLQLVYKCGDGEALRLDQKSKNFYAADLAAPDCGGYALGAVEWNPGSQEGKLIRSDDYEDSEFENMGTISVSADRNTVVLKIDSRKGNITCNALDYSSSDMIEILNRKCAQHSD